MYVYKQGSCHSGHVSPLPRPRPLRLPVPTPAPQETRDIVLGASEPEVAEYVLPAGVVCSLMNTLSPRRRTAKLALETVTVSEAVASAMASAPTATSAADGEGTPAASVSTAGSVSAPQGLAQSRAKLMAARMLAAAKVVSPNTRKSVSAIMATAVRRTRRLRTVVRPNRDAAAGIPDVCVHCRGCVLCRAARAAAAAAASSAKPMSSFVAVAQAAMIDATGVTATVSGGLREGVVYHSRIALRAPGDLWLTVEPRCSPTLVHSHVPRKSSFFMLLSVGRTSYRGGLIFGALGASAQRACVTPPAMRAHARTHARTARHTCACSTARTERLTRVMRTR